MYFFGLWCIFFIGMNNKNNTQFMRTNTRARALYMYINNKQTNTRKCIHTHTHTNTHTRMKQNKTTQKKLNWLFYVDQSIQSGIILFPWLFRIKIRILFIQANWVSERILYYVNLWLCLCMCVCACVCLVYLMEMLTIICRISIHIEDNDQSFWQRNRELKCEKKWITWKMSLVLSRSDSFSFESDNSLAANSMRWMK